MSIDRNTPSKKYFQTLSAAGAQSIASNWCAATQNKIVGSSPLLKRCLRLATEAANTEKNILILGETGTGKDLFARFIHRQTRFSQSRYIEIDCRVSDQKSLEAVFSADRGKGEKYTGFCLAAGRGTLYLDEIHELSPLCQGKIRRLLVDSARRVRVIATCQQNLEMLTNQGRFRNDLLTLLQNYRIDLPALRDRADDILELSGYFLERFCLWNGLPIKTGTPEFNAILLQYPWPGNVRELANTLEQSLLRAGLAKTLFPKHLPSHIRIQVTKFSMQRQPAGS